MFSLGVGLLFWTALLALLPASMLAAFLIFRSVQKKQRLARAKQPEVIEIIQFAQELDGTLSVEQVVNELCIAPQEVEKLMDLLCVDGVFHKEIPIEGNPIYHLTSIPWLGGK